MGIHGKKDFLRKASVAGRFYPGSRAALARAVSSLMPDDPDRRDAIAVIAPHAGFVYSGATAGRVLSSINIPDRVVLMGPNHTGMGPAASVMPSGAWEMPTGVVEVDEALAAGILASSPLFKADFEAHLVEHSLEVMLPFVHALNPSARIVPVTVMRADRAECEKMGQAIAGVISAASGPVLILVSSDMNHYESEGTTRAKDARAIEKITALDAQGLLEVTDRQDITMCGVMPAAIAIYAARLLGASRGRLAAYTTSAEASGDTNAVVGYAGVVID